MSAMRATGIARAAGLTFVGSSGAGRSMRGAPTPFIEPCPNANPPPGSPICPSIAASAIAIQ